MIDDLIDDMIESFSSTNRDVPNNKHIFEIEDVYTKMFGHNVPREMLPDSITDDMLAEAMKECIEKKKDCLYEILQVTINKDYLY